MASLIFAQAKSIRKKALKLCNDLPQTYNYELGYSTINNEQRNHTYDSSIENQRREFQEILKIAKLLHDDYKEITNNYATNWYFITIRPKENVPFINFINTLNTYIKRAFMIEYTLTLEQKDPFGSGDGFHAHIVCNTKHRSKGEILRDTISTFNDLCEKQAIQVDTTRNPKDIINKYMIAYESKDDHKICTKNGDIIWRKNNNISDLYSTNENPFSVLSIKSNETAQNSIIPYIVEMD